MDFYFEKNKLEFLEVKLRYLILRTQDMFKSRLDTKKMEKINEPEETSMVYIQTVAQRANRMDYAEELKDHSEKV